MLPFAPCFASTEMVSPVYLLTTRSEANYVSLIRRSRSA
jgi:hypothetical protein